MDFTIRRADESDRTYIQRLNFLADVHGDESRPLDDQTLPGVAAYVDAWDPDLDGGVIAFDEFRTPAGGAWLRHWESPEARGHANLGPEIPEIGIAIEQRFYGHGLSKLLLDGVIALAREQGATKIALSVAENNPRARHVYEKYGFIDEPNAPRPGILSKEI